MRVRFIGRMPKTGWSGGRLLAMTLAESLAMQDGAVVDFLVDNVPEMRSDFADFTQVMMLPVDLLRLDAYVDKHIDVVVVVPSLGSYDQLKEAAFHAVKCRAKVVLLNFETPDWFNELCPGARDASRWSGWELVASLADMVLSISAEGNKYAQGFYKSYADGCRFEYIHTAINSVLADRAKEWPHVDKEKTVVVLSREDAHKGFDDLAPLAMSRLEGFTVKVFLGMGQMDQAKVDALDMELGMEGVRLEVNGPIHGVEKFELLKRAALMYFPSRFEGFGIPPVEAIYCQLPCVVNDLPVLHEMGDDNLFFGNVDEPGSMDFAIKSALCYTRVGGPMWLNPTSTMKDCGERLSRILGEVL